MDEGMRVKPTRRAAEILAIADTRRVVSGLRERAVPMPWR
jgi:hypothetical protein